MLLTDYNHISSFFAPNSAMILSQHCQNIFQQSAAVCWKYRRIQQRRAYIRCPLWFTHRNEARNNHTRWPQA